MGKKIPVIRTEDLDERNKYQVFAELSSGSKTYWYCCDSLPRLKKYIREETWVKFCYLGYTNLDWQFSYNQQVVAYYPYTPRR